MKKLVETKSSRRVPIVGIGASAGGLNAFKEFFKNMPHDAGVAFVLIQHLDPFHESMMVDLLSTHTKMKVVQGDDQMTAEANCVYMIPPNRYITVQKGVLRLTKPLQPRGLRMPIDHFFNSLAEDQNEKAVCIILSGTGTDGTVGLKSIKSHGGLTMVQIPEEAQYDGMPKSAISTGVVDHVVSIEDMPELIVQYLKHSYVNGKEDENDDTKPSHFQRILEIIQSQQGHNFKFYKKNTLYRRINRRMGLKAIEKMSDYVDFLEKNPQESEELFKDLLIGVTGFFREKDSWAHLEKQVLSKLFNNRTNEPLRVWVAGCSTGEEAYTIAIIINECFEKEGLTPEYNIFATDIDSHALEVARNGRYTEGIANDIPEPLLKKYFKKEDSFYRVSNKLRENIVFSVQNLISDPPFSKLDLITCRNLLIYLESEIQLKVTELFHFALKRTGFLMLGNSETIGQNDYLFRPISKKWRIYEKLGSPIPSRPNFPIVPSGTDWNVSLKGTELDVPGNRQPSEIIKEALLAKFAPTSVLINRNHEVIFHFGETHQYLQFPQGEHTNDLYVLVREGLTTRMRGAVHKAIRTEEPVSIKSARVKREGSYTKVHFTVTPLLTLGATNDGLYLVSFEDEVLHETKIGDVDLPIEEEALVKQLELELSSTKEELQNTIEELETSNEELKASNEEVMSMNEELQSSNEELETSKEELQSLNEELNTVNNELQEKIISLESTNNDVTNLVNSTNIAVVFLDTDFNIKYYTPFSKKLFNLISTDINRPIKHITPRFEDSSLLKDAQEVLDSLKPAFAEIITDEDEWYSRKIFPYRTEDNHIQGIILTFENITELKLQRELMREKSARYELAQKAASMGYWEHDLIKETVIWGDEMGHIFSLKPNQFPKSYEGFMNLILKEDRDAFDKQYRNAIDGQRFFTQNLRIKGKKGELIYIENYATVLYDEKRATRIIHSVKDVTEKVKAEQLAEEMKHLFAAVPVGLFVINKSGKILMVNQRAVELLDYTPTDLVGSPFKSLLANKIPLSYSKSTKEPIKTALFTGNGNQLSCSIAISILDINKGEMHATISIVT